MNYRIGIGICDECISKKYNLNKEALHLTHYVLDHDSCHVQCDSFADELEDRFKKDKVTDRSFSCYSSIYSSYLIVKNVQREEILSAITMIKISNSDYKYLKIYVRRIP